MRQIMPHNEWLRSFNNQKVEVLGKYRGRRHPIEVRCKKCGKVWAPLAMQVSRGQGCSNCQYREKQQNYRVPLAEFDRRLEDTHKGKIRRISADNDYKGVFGKMEYKCLVCGNEWETTGSCVVNEPFCGCPKCAKSKYEEKVAEYLDSLGIEYVQGACLADCKSSGGGKSFFDFILPGIGVIEVDGEQHFKFGDEFWFKHSHFENIVVSDELKTKYCEEHRIPLLRIRYDQIRRSKDYRLEIDSFFRNPDQYVAQHNKKYISKEAYYEEREQMLKQNGIDDVALGEQAMFCPTKRKNAAIYTDLQGREYTSLAELCKENHISYKTMKKKRKSGMTIKDVLIENTGKW